MLQLNCWPKELILAGYLLILIVPSLRSFGIPELFLGPNSVASLNRLSRSPTKKYISRVEHQYPSFPTTVHFLRPEDRSVMTPQTIDSFHDFYLHFSCQHSKGLLAPGLKFKRQKHPIEQKCGLLWMAVTGTQFS
jgi:hypothetical protein